MIKNEFNTDAVLANINAMQNSSSNKRETNRKQDWRKAKVTNDTQHLLVQITINMHTCTMYINHIHL